MLYKCRKGLWVMNGILEARKLWGCKNYAFSEIANMRAIFLKFLVLSWCLNEYIVLFSVQLNQTMRCLCLWLYIVALNGKNLYQSVRKVIDFYLENELCSFILMLYWLIGIYLFSTIYTLEAFAFNCSMRICNKFHVVILLNYKGAMTVQWVWVKVAIKRSGSSLVWAVVVWW